MEMEGAVTPEGIRRTRAALAEIPARLDRLRVGSSPLQPVANTRDRSPALPPSYLSPAQSPDELVINQRGRRRLPVTWSPDIELKKNMSFHSIVRTPPKESFSRFSPTKLGVTLRSTPRKRLLLGDTDNVPLSSEKIDFSHISTPEKFKLSDAKWKDSSVPIKRMKIEKKLETEYNGPLDLALKGLSPTQLITMIKDIIEKHPEIDHEIRRELPAPDLRSLEEKLSYLKCNIFKSLPTSRLISKTDSPAYSRVSTHLSTFRKCLTEQGKMLVESQHWDSVVEYVLMAWSYVRATPTWDNQVHNTQRKMCFKALINFCMGALTKGRVGRATLLRLQERLPGLAADSDDVVACQRRVQALLN